MASGTASESAAELKLFGMWASSYTHRVQLALKLKGLEFEYVEEDLANKSPSLLLYNPVHKKVPVLLHAGRALAESVVILQYVDETWEQNPIMPRDPYERAVVRFWCHFCDDKLAPAVGTVFRSTGEEQKVAVGEVHRNLDQLERELREGHFKGRRFFGGDAVGLLDIVVGCGSYWLSVFEEVAEVKLVDPTTFPLFHSWLRDFEAQEAVREIIPPAGRLLEYARGIRHYLLSLAPSQHDAAAAAAAAPGDANDGGGTGAGVDGANVAASTGTGEEDKKDC